MCWGCIKKEVRDLIFEVLVTAGITMGICIGLFLASTAGYTMLKHPFISLPVVLLISFTITMVDRALKPDDED